MHRIIYIRLIPKDHILYKINQQVDFSFVNEACKDLYSQDQGRPVKNMPEMMFRSSIVQYLNNYSDRDMEQAARYNIIVKWFILILRPQCIGRLQGQAWKGEMEEAFFSNPETN
jgi:IS5 family transposase